MCTPTNIVTDVGSRTPEPAATVGIAPARPGLFGTGLVIIGLVISGPGLGGCASTAPARPASAATSPASIMDVGGKFSMRYTATTPTQRTEFVAGQFTLHRDAQRITLELTSPFGQQIAHAEQRLHAADGTHAGGDDDAVVRTADHREIRGRTLDDVIAQAVGFRVPASRIPDWLDGRFERVIARTDVPPMVRAFDSGWDIERRGQRWDFRWDQAGERIEVRLVTRPDAATTDANQAAGTPP